MECFFLIDETKWMKTSKKKAINEIKTPIPSSKKMLEKWLSVNRGGFFWGLIFVRRHWSMLGTNLLMNLFRIPLSHRTWILLNLVRSLDFIILKIMEKVMLQLIYMGLFRISFMEPYRKDFGVGQFVGNCENASSVHLISLSDGEFDYFAHLKWSINQT